jgi:hypothetical protein
MDHPAPAGGFARVGGRSLWLIIGLGLALHAGWLAWVLGHSVGPGGAAPWVMADTGSYLVNAERLAQGLPLSPVFRERLLLPALIGVAERVLGQPQYVVWLIWLLHVPAALAVAALARRLAGRAGAGLVAAACYFVWPGALASAPLVGTDLLHAQGLLVATALTLRWLDRPGSPTLYPLAAWWLVQLTRPTFYLASVTLAPLLWRSGRPRAVAALVAGLLVWPAFFTALNLVEYGVAAPSLAGVESLHRNVVARIRALQRNERTPGPLTEYFVEEREVVAKADPDWAGLSIYSPGGGTDFERHYRQLQEKGQAFVASNRSWFVRSSVAELQNQLRRPHAVIGVAAAAGGSRAGDAWLGRIQKIGLLLILIGAAQGVRRAGGYTLFYALCCALVLSACMVLWWESSRIRLPLEALGLPLLAVAVGNRTTGWALGLIVVAGWLPIRLGWATEGWVLGLAGLVVLGQAALAWRGGRNRGRGEGVAHA